MLASVVISVIQEIDIMWPLLFIYILLIILFWGIFVHYQLRFFNISPLRLANSWALVFSYYKGGIINIIGRTCSALRSQHVCSETCLLSLFIVCFTRSYARYTDFLSVPKPSETQTAIIDTYMTLILKDIKTHSVVLWMRETPVVWTATQKLKTRHILKQFPMAGESRQ